MSGTFLEHYKGFILEKMEAQKTTIISIKRPKEGKWEGAESLVPVAAYASKEKSLESLVTWAKQHIDRGDYDY